MVLDFVRVLPTLPSKIEYVMLESFTCAAVIKYDDKISTIRPQVWTNAINKRNPSGKWHALNMTYIRTEEDGITHHYRCKTVFTGQGQFEFTVRVGILSEDYYEHGSSSAPLDKDEDDDSDIELWKWAGGFGTNGKIIVHPPNDNHPWTKGPQAVAVAPNVFVGNYIAASHAPELGFNAVLNMTVECEDFYPESAKVEYKCLGVPDGAHNPIPAEIIKEAVQWIDDRVKENMKVLVHCRAGIGRSGSIGISYLYYKNPSWTFKDTLQAIWSAKPEVYPHKSLDSTLEKLFTRDLISDAPDASLAPEAYSLTNQM